MYIYTYIYILYIYSLPNDNVKATDLTKLITK